MEKKFAGKRQQFFEKMMEGEQDEEQIMKELKLSRKTVMKWTEDEEYLCWMEQMAKKYAHLWLPKVVKAMCRQSSAGNTTAQKLYFDFLGKNASSTESVLMRLLNVLEENHLQKQEQK